MTTTITHGTIGPLAAGEEFVPAPTTDHAIRPFRWDIWPFGFMFPELQHQGVFLEASDTTIKDLKRLGTEGMIDPTEKDLPGVPVPAIYTFFGQFVDHDITREKGSADVSSLTSPAPLSPDVIGLHIVNSRSPNLDLDHVYGPDVDGQLAPCDSENPNKLRIDSVKRGNLGPVPGKDVYHDLPRGRDGKALIGDQRNDENIVISQLHVAFLRAHNNLVDRGLDFDAAKKLLRQHYQWIVLDDFLERIADPMIVKTIRFKGARFFNPPPRSFFMPLEFSVAAFRFGHSKVRPGYNQFNSQNLSGELGSLFTNAGKPLTDSWVIDWRCLLRPERGLNLPRPIDPSLAEPLRTLPGTTISDADTIRNLAVRNLLRGYILRMPTGQAVATAMASQGILPLTELQLLSVAKEIPAQEDVLKSTKFLTETPLWFYILAEAAFYSRGSHLGPVGSTIVAEVLIGVLRNSTDSILADPQWRPTLGNTPGKFDLEDLLRLAGVL